MMTMMILGAKQIYQHYSHATLWTFYSTLTKFFSLRTPKEYMENEGVSQCMVALDQYCYNDKRKKILKIEFPTISCQSPQCISRINTGSLITEILKETLQSMKAPVNTNLIKAVNGFRQCLKNTLKSCYSILS